MILWTCVSVYFPFCKALSLRNDMALPVEAIHLGSNRSQHGFLIKEDIRFQFPLGTIRILYIVLIMQ